LLGIEVGEAFLRWLTLYFLLTCAYSLWLKRQALTDCFMLAALYVLRIIAGGAAVRITPSMWLLVFSVFIFLSLAFVKRYTELTVQSKIGNDKVHGRGYTVQDADLISSLGVTAGYGSVVVLALYLQSETVTRLYTRPELILFAVPLMLFWVSWLWLKAHRAEMLDDPMVFALKDRVSLSVIALIGFTFLIAAIGIPGAS
jgi:4-hydroxybenzoate polyprenyltransferase